MAKELKVADRFRKNELSLVEGGSEVTLVHSNGKRFKYDKIKNVDAYIKRAKADAKVVEILVNGESVWKRS